ncbi:MAG: hypothetical protein HQL90_07510 [Magnetococcales bacterium]|nr:hypothetical protein [Magnetococcales bacterium]
MIWVRAVMVFAGLSLFFLTTLPAIGEHSSHGSVYRLLILDSQLGHPYDEVREAMLEGLAGFGYRQGENLEIVVHALGNDLQYGEAILKQELDRPYHVVYVGGTMATMVAKGLLLGKQQPVVFASPTDPIGIGVIDDFHTPPKANFTGVCYPVPVKARLRFLRHLMPKARVFGMIYADMPQSHSYNGWIRALLEQEPEFKDIHFLFRAVPLIGGEEGDKRMAEMAVPLIRELDGQVDAFVKSNDQLGTRRHFAKVAYDHATKPLIGMVRNDVMEQWGATAVVYPSHESIGRQAADMIRRILSGEPVSRILPQWPARFGYAVDLPKTRQFGLTVPIGLLQLAGRNIIK